MTYSDFLRLFHTRGKNLMWLVGAGACASSGIPTATHMIWNFKRQIYCSNLHVPIQAVSDLGNPVIQEMIQTHLNSVTGHPRADEFREYAHYFEFTHPSAQDRRRYIEAMIADKRPSYGHLALVTLMAIQKCEIVWTTNFDKLVENAAAKIFNTVDKLIVATPDNANIAVDAIQTGRRPLLGKLHGDFFSEHLKNTSSELKAQDQELRASLLQATAAYGLIVAGYSGRDDSVMATLEEGLSDGKRYPHGIFWMQRTEAPAPLRVQQFIAKAKALGIDAHFVAAETFDELAADLLLLETDIPQGIRDILNDHPAAKRHDPSPIPPTSGSWPVLRFNAVRLEAWPTSCGAVDCEIGGYKDIHEAIQTTGARLIAGRIRRAGVIFFGPEEEARKAFSNHNIKSIAIYPIEPRRLASGSAELGLLYEAACFALSAPSSLMYIRRRSHHLLVIPPNASGDPQFKPLFAALSEIAGNRGNIQWSEGVEVYLEYHLQRFWLIIEPKIYFHLADDQKLSTEGKEFIRERLARRYNPIWNKLIDAWMKVLTKGNTTLNFEAFSSLPGFKASFKLDSVTAFSRRQLAR